MTAASRARECADSRAQSCALAAFLWTAIAVTGCDRSPDPSKPDSGVGSRADAQDAAREAANSPAVNPGMTRSNGPPLGPPPEGPTPRSGMVFIPPGALVVGTPRDRRPRRADRELPGEQVMLEGFYIDQLAYPNEEGAIPVTNVSQGEAALLCAEKSKRLCTELEWERACKGPDNRSFEYGEAYRQSICETGRSAQLRPGGYLVGCQSDFGVRDMHGGPFEWTSSAFGRGMAPDRVTLRGGNGEYGELVGRCANAEPADPVSKSGTIGFRCCAGQENQARVELRMDSAPGLVARAAFDAAIEAALLRAIPDEAKAKLEQAGAVRRERVWLWHPVANEELHLLTLCGRGRPPPHGPKCGLLVARIAVGHVEALAWVESGEWVANLHKSGPFDLLWMVGGDTRGSFKRLLAYQYGNVQVGELSWGNPPRARNERAQTVRKK